MPSALFPVSFVPAAHEDITLPTHLTVALVYCCHVLALSIVLCSSGVIWKGFLERVSKFPEVVTLLAPWATGHNL